MDKFMDNLFLWFFVVFVASILVITNMVYSEAYQNGSLGQDLYKIFTVK